MLKSPYIDWLESMGLKFDFFKKYGPLIDLIKQTNKYEGSYHDTDHLIGVGYIAYLMYRPKVRSDHYIYDKFVKAALLHDFNYLGDSKDHFNIAHSQGMVRTLSYEYPEIIPPEEVDEINKIIGYTEYDFSNPLGNPPECVKERELFYAIRDCDQLYASLYFDEEMFNKLYEDIGKRLGFTKKGFLERNKAYVVSVNEGFVTLFAKTVGGEIMEELLAVHDDLSLSLE